MFTATPRLALAALLIVSGLAAGCGGADAPDESEIVGRWTGSFAPSGVPVEAAVEFNDDGTGTARPVAEQPATQWDFTWTIDMEVETARVIFQPIAAQSEEWLPLRATYSTEEGAALEGQGVSLVKQ